MCNQCGSKVNKPLPHHCVAAEVFCGPDRVVVVAAVVKMLVVSTAAEVQATLLRSKT
jgi:hypothetical protein